MWRKRDICKQLNYRDTAHGVGACHSVLQWLPRKSARRCRECSVVTGLLPSQPSLLYSSAGHGFWECVQVSAGHGSMQESSCWVVKGAGGRRPTGRSLLGHLPTALHKHISHQAAHVQMKWFKVLSPATAKLSGAGCKTWRQLGFVAVYSKHSPENKEDIHEDYIYSHVYIYTHSLHPTKLFIVSQQPHA